MSASESPGAALQRERWSISGDGTGVKKAAAVTGTNPFSGEPLQSHAASSQGDECAAGEQQDILLAGRSSVFESRIKDALKRGCQSCSASHQLPGLSSPLCRALSAVKGRGNEAHKAGDMMLALQCYERGLWHIEFDALTWNVELLPKHKDAVPVPLPQRSSLALGAARPVAGRPWTPSRWSCSR